MHVGVIGAGWWGKNIVNTFEEIPSVSRVTVFDRDPRTYEKFAANKKSTFVQSVEEILDNPAVSAICVASPPSSHYELTKSALLKRKHVLVEKPPASETHQVEELGRIAANGHLVYMIDALYLFMEPIGKVREILQSGELQDIRYVQMFRVGDELRREGAGLARIQKTMFDNGVDVVEDLFFHDAGILQHLFGAVEMNEVEKRCLYHSRLCDTALIKFSRGILPLELTLSWALAGRRRGMVVYDADYILEYDGLKSDAQVTKHSLKTNTRESFSFENRPPLKSMLQFFIDCSTGSAANFLGVDFMMPIMKHWERIRNEK
jgi:predicted dehydrogenase